MRHCAKTFTHCLRLIPNPQSQAHCTFAVKAHLRNKCFVTVLYSFVHSKHVPDKLSRPSWVSTGAINCLQTVWSCAILFCTSQTANSITCHTIPLRVQIDISAKAHSQGIMQHTLSTLHAQACIRGADVNSRVLSVKCPTVCIQKTL